MRRTVIVSLIVALVALVVVGLLPAGTASAAVGGARLENLLMREQIILTDQQQRLELSNQVSAKTQEWIDGLKSQGKDTAALEAALSAYKTAATAAAQYLDTAQSTLDAKAGFDANGKATNLKQALATIRAAGKAERQCHLTITPAAISFRQAVLSCRESE